MVDMAMPPFPSSSVRKVANFNSNFPDADPCLRKQSLSTPRDQCVHRPVLSRKDGWPTRRSGSLRTRQISAPRSSYFAGSVSFIIWCTSCPRRVLKSATESDMEHPQRKRWRSLHLNFRRSAVTEITTGLMSEIGMLRQLVSSGLP
jgi:hypothetical protein